MSICRLRAEESWKWPRKVRIRGFKKVESALGEEDPAERIIEFGKEKDVDVIAMGNGRAGASKKSVPSKRFQ